MINEYKDHMRKKWEKENSGYKILDEQFNEDIDLEPRYARNRGADQVYDTLKYIQNVGNFQENDILIKQTRGYCEHAEDYRWFTEEFSSSNSAPRKYKVVHVDDVGLPYIMKVSMKGELCGDMKCIAGYDLNYTKFEYDPDFIDHQILADEGEDFDPQEVYKEKRDEYFKTRPKAKRETKQA